MPSRLPSAHNAKELLTRANCRLRRGQEADRHAHRISGQSNFVVARPDMVKNRPGPAVFQGFAASDDARIACDFANLLVDHSMRNPPVPQGCWRGVNINQNAIYLECSLATACDASSPAAPVLRLCRKGP